MRSNLFLLITFVLGGCSQKTHDYSDFPLECRNIKTQEVANFNFAAQRISLNIPKKWAALKDTSTVSIPSVFFRDTTIEYYQSSFFAVMIYKDIDIPLKTYFELDYNSTLADPSFKGVKKGQITLNGKECFWQLTHDYSDGHCITLAYYLKDNDTNRVIMIPTSTYLVDDYETELCNLFSLVKSIEI